MNSRHLLAAAAMAVALLCAIHPAAGHAALDKTLTRVGTLELGTGQNNAEHLVIDRTRGFLYAATFTSPVHIVRIRLATAAAPAQIVNSLLLDAGENFAGGLALDEENGLLYLTTVTSPVIVVKMDVSDATIPPVRVAALTMPPGCNLATYAAHDPLTNTLYFSTLTSPAQIGKVQCNAPADPPTSNGFLTLDTGENQAYALAIDPVRAIGWAGLNVFPARIVQFSMGPAGAPPVRAEALIFPDDLNYVDFLHYDPLHQQLHGALYESYGFLKVDVSGSTPVFAGVLNPGPESYSLYAMAVDSVLGIAVAAGYVGPPLQAYLLSLGDQSRGQGLLAVTTLQPTDTSNYLQAALDPDNLFAYFPTETPIPGRILILALAKGNGVDLKTEIGKFSGATKNSKTKVKAQATITNESGTNAGPFFVRTFLSRDRQWSADDILIGKERFVKSLAPGKSRKAPASGSLTGIAPGTYHIITVADPQDLNDDAFRTNNVAVSGPLQL